jgi:hypothetical protein
LSWHGKQRRRTTRGHEQGIYFIYFKIKIKEAKEIAKIKAKQLSSSKLLESRDKNRPDIPEESNMNSINLSTEPTEAPKKGLNLKLKNKK